MAIGVEFHFDFGSPNAYLSHLVIPEIESRTGVEFEYLPVLLGGVFKATNNVSPMMSLQGIRNKPEYQALETRRYLKKHEQASSFNSNPHFPVNTLQIMRGAVAANRLGPQMFSHYVRVVFEAMWRNAQKMDDPQVILDVLSAADLPADELISGMQDPQVKAELIANTETAVNRGVFGSPSFFVGQELFFGKDRLVDVEEEILSQSKS